jgi:hypothetical protein
MTSATQDLPEHNKVMDRLRVLADRIGELRRHL